MLPVIHHHDYVAPLPPGHRFPMPKFNMLRELIARELVAGVRFVEPAEATVEQIHLAHDPRYAEAFLAGKLDDEAVRRIGLPWSPALVRRTRLEVGGTIEALRIAAREGLACNAAGGTHHAHRDFGSGFCVLNDLAVAACVALHEQLAERILIIDLDVHQGDGSAAIFADQPRVFTFSMHAAKNFPARKPPGDRDVPLPDSLDDAGYLTLLDEQLVPLLESVEPDLVLYDAGVDPHTRDPLGRLALTSQGLAARDRRVLGACLEREIPTACVIGGGYGSDLHELTQRHSILFRVASELRAAHVDENAEAL